MKTDDLETERDISVEARARQGLIVSDLNTGKWKIKTNFFTILNKEEEKYYRVYNLQRENLLLIQRLNLKLNIGALILKQKLDRTLFKDFAIVTDLDGNRFYTLKNLTLSYLQYEINQLRSVEDQENLKRLYQLLTEFVVCFLFLNTINTERSTLNAQEVSCLENMFDIWKTIEYKFPNHGSYNAYFWGRLMRNEKVLEEFPEQLKSLVQRLEWIEKKIQLIS